MKIICPNCSTAYDIEPESLGESGRQVKCTRCENRWHASPDDDPVEILEPDQDAEPDEGVDAVSGESFAEADFEVDETAPDDAPPPATGTDIQETVAKAYGSEAAKKPADIESQARKPKVKVKRREKRPRERRAFSNVKSAAKKLKVQRIAGTFLFVMALAVAALSVQFRAEIVSRVPDLASLYQLAGMEVNLRGLAFRDLRTFRELEDGSVVLVVEGTIENPTRKPAYVPAVRLALRSEDAQEIYAWIVEPRIRQLEGGKTTRFRTRLSTPPELAADIQVRFTERKNRQAKL
ncbi:thioredoxin [Stappia sp. GBMRC 2046]|uniref:Thioredoxin n=1 Tax=Stappia sediminis TaxID=2692190 RepID=A0A7X3S7L7_9HYPH|nr:zinc-ribbon domain-containing protein [Stappia sediminis]MXN64859.1 thioredoxin [Stappia sediminis]